MSKRKPFSRNCAALPPSHGFFSNTSTLCPRAASVHAAASPASPDPITPTFIPSFIASLLLSPSLMLKIGYKSAAPHPSRRIHHSLHAAQPLAPRPCMRRRNQPTEHSLMQIMRRLIVARASAPPHRDHLHRRHLQQSFASSRCSEAAPLSPAKRHPAGRPSAQSGRSPSPCPLSPGSQARAPHAPRRTSLAVNANGQASFAAIASAILPARITISTGANTSVCARSHVRRHSTHQPPAASSPPPRRSPRRLCSAPPPVAHPAASASPRSPSRPRPIPAPSPTHRTNSFSRAPSASTTRTRRGAMHVADPFSRIPNAERLDRPPHIRRRQHKHRIAAGQLHHAGSHPLRTAGAAPPVPQLLNP